VCFLAPPPTVHLSEFSLRLRLAREFETGAADWLESKSWLPFSRVNLGKIDSWKPMKA
jgi:hypothetical protein